MFPGRLMARTNGSVGASRLNLQHTLMGTNWEHRCPFAINVDTIWSQRRFVPSHPEGRLCDVSTMCVQCKASAAGTDSKSSSRKPNASPTWQLQSSEALAVVSTADGFSRFGPRQARCSRFPALAPTCLTGVEVQLLDFAAVAQSVEQRTFNWATARRNLWNYGTSEESELTNLTIRCQIDEFSAG